MIVDPQRPGFYAPTNLALIDKYRESIASIAERWLDEAAEFAVAGNPQRAGHIEYMIGRLA